MKVRKIKKLVAGVGINDADYVVYAKDATGRRVRCPYYQTWKNMVERCYNTRSHINTPIYADCSVCDEWLLFSNFKKWMETQDWKGKHLDKDLLVAGNKVYSPTSCLFVTARVNLSLILCGGSRGEQPIGSYYNKSNKTYQASCSAGRGKKTKLGLYQTPFEAHRAWQLAKITVLGSIKDSDPDFLVKIGLQRVIDKIQDDYDNLNVTIDFT